MKKKLTSHQQHRNGALTVEFAIVAPIIFALFIGSLELTSMNLIRQTAGNAAYEAARTAIIPGATHAEAKQVARELLNSVRASTNVLIDIQDDGRVVLVTISVPVSANGWGLARFSGGMTIVKRCSLSREI